jgi:hypothetical protein
MVQGLSVYYKKEISLYSIRNQPMTGLTQPQNLSSLIEALSRLPSTPAPEPDCCGVPGCEHEEDTLVNQVVLVDAETVGRGPATLRLEAFVLAEYNNSLKLRFKSGHEGYYCDECVTDELGPATSAQYTEFGVTEPEAPPTPAYSTGTYIAVTPKGVFLIEVDRVGDTYYIHEVGGSDAEPLTPDIWECLDNFSDPDGPGNYTADPGMYYAARIGKMIEVIPHGGYSFYRFINDSELRRLSPNMVKDCTQVESDTFEVNAIMVMPQDAPKVEGKTAYRKALDNNEDAPTGCCQAVPREEPAEV